MNITDATYTHGLAEADPIATFRAVFERQRAFAEHAMTQLDDAAFFRAPAPGVNSVAVIVRHIAGNLHSRWSDMPGMLAGTADAEKPTRDRDAELAPLNPAPDHFAAERAAIETEWAKGWATLTEALDTLTPADLVRTIPVRSKPHTVLAALARQLDHYAYHTGQIVQTARLFVPTDQWKWFTLPPGGSAAFNRAMMGENRPA